MDPVTIGALIMGGTSLLGGLFGSKNQRSANAQNTAQFHQQRADDLAYWNAGLEVSDRQRAEDKIWANQVADEEYGRQKEFAQMGIQWKAQDAAAAGLHPLAALGGSGAMYSPTSAVGSSSFNAPGRSAQGGNVVSQGDYGVSDMGQNIGRALMATQSEQQVAANALQMRHMELQNANLELQLASQAASIFGQPVGPGMTSGVHSDVGGSHTIKPAEIVASNVLNPGYTAGSDSPALTMHDVGHGLRMPGFKGDDPWEDLEFAKYAIMGKALVDEWRGGRDPSLDEINLRFASPPALRRGQAWHWDAYRARWELVELPWSEFRRHGGTVK